MYLGVEFYIICVVPYHTITEISVMAMYISVILLYTGGYVMVLIMIFITTSISNHTENVRIILLIRYSSKLCQIWVYPTTFLSLLLIVPYLLHSSIFSCTLMEIYFRHWISIFLHYSHIYQISFLLNFILISIQKNANSHTHTRSNRQVFSSAPSSSSNLHCLPLFFVICVFLVF